MAPAVSTAPAAGTTGAAPRALPLTQLSQLAAKNKEYNNCQNRYNNKVCHLSVPPDVYLRIILISVYATRGKMSSFL